MPYSARTSDSGAGGGGATPTPARRSTWRRMSFIGSTERTRGTTSKLLTGGGEVTNHSSVLAFHGSGPALGPFDSARTMLITDTSVPSASTNEPTVEIRLYVFQPALASYS